MKKFYLNAFLILLFSIFNMSSAFAVSVTTNVISGKSDNDRCYWTGQVTVEVAYELTSKGSSNLYLSVDDRSTGQNHTIQQKAVSRGAGTVLFNFNAGGCLRGNMRAYFG